MAIQTQKSKLLDCERTRSKHRVAATAGKFVIPPLPSLRFRSLRAFVDGTREMVQDEACPLARTEHSKLHAWMSATPTTRRGYRSPEVDALVDYYWHLDSLLHRCEDGYSSLHGYAATLSEEALKHWDQNASRHAN